MIMFLLSTDQKGEVGKLRRMDRQERHVIVNDFILEHSDEIDGLIEECLERIQAALAASTEGTGPGKPEQDQASPPS